MACKLYVFVDPTFLQAISLGGRGINDFLSHLVRRPCIGVTTDCVLRNLPWELSDEAECIMYRLKPFGSCNHGISSIQECFTDWVRKGLPDLAFATKSFSLSNVLRGVSAGVKIVEPPAAPPVAEKPKRKVEARPVVVLKKRKGKKGDEADKGKVEAQPVVVLKKRKGENGDETDKGKVEAQPVVVLKKRKGGKGDETEKGKVEAQPAAEKLKAKEKRKKCRRGRGRRGMMKLSRLLLWNV